MFRFSIRDVLWLTVVVALGIAWVLEHQRNTKLAHDLGVVENEAQVSRLAIKSLHEDIDRITQALPRHGLTVVWSNDLRPTVQKSQ
jgi:hypothetical protein